MPELPVREVRLPELRLPEIDREQIVNALSGVRLPTVELPTVQRGRSEDGKRAGFDWRAIDWPDVDLGPALAGAGALVRLGSRARPLSRSRWGIAAGAVVIAGVAVAVILAQPPVRERAGRTIRRVRDRFAPQDDPLQIDADLEDTKADVETVETEVVTATDVAIDTAGDTSEATQTAGADAAVDPAGITRPI